MSATSEGLPAPEGTYEASDAHLKKQIGLFGLIALAVSVQIGSGWLLATLAAAAIAGPASILTWILGAAFFAIIGVTWMELGAMLPRSGAGVRYPRLTHGAFLSWFNGWGYLIAALSLPVIEAQAVLTYVGGHWPGLNFLKVVNGTTVLSWTGTIVIRVVMSSGSITAVPDACTTRPTTSTQKVGASAESRVPARKTTMAVVKA